MVDTPLEIEFVCGQRYGLFLYDGIKKIEVVSK